MNRAAREKEAYDEGTVWEDSHAWHMRFKHVFYCPNTIHNENIFNDLIERDIEGKRVLGYWLRLRRKLSSSFINGRRLCMWNRYIGEGYRGGK